MNLLCEHIKEILEFELEGSTGREAKVWINNLVKSDDCAGIISCLINSDDKARFFDEHEDEILELAAEYEFRPCTVTLGIRGFKNDLVWFAFEILAPDLFEQIEQTNYNDDEETGQTDFDQHSTLNHAQLGLTK